jgi:hypothetical protein
MLQLQVLYIFLWANVYNALAIEKRLTKSINLPGFHKPVHALYVAGTPLSKGHPGVAALYAGFLFKGHPNLDTLLANPKANPLPKGHPNLDSFSGGVAAPKTVPTTVPTKAAPTTVPVSVPKDSVPKASVPAIPAKTVPAAPPAVLGAGTTAVPPAIPATLPVIPVAAPPATIPAPTAPKVPTTPADASKTISVPGFHKPIHALYFAGTPLSDGHPGVQALYAGFLFQGHPNLDTLMLDPKGNPLPPGHPNLDTFSAGSGGVSGSSQGGAATTDSGNTVIYVVAGMGVLFAGLVVGTTFGG